MRISQFIETYFWIFLLAALILGLSFPIYNDFFMSLLEPELMLMLFFIFLKTDLFLILEKIKNYKLMIYLSSMCLLIIPSSFFLIVNIFNHNLAIAVLLLTSMPAAAASPALTDIVKGKIIRIAHMGHISQWDLLVAFGALETTLADLGYDFERGAGIAALTRELERK